MNSDSVGGWRQELRTKINIGGGIAMAYLEQNNCVAVHNNNEEV